MGDSGLLARFNNNIRCIEIGKDYLCEVEGEGLITT